MCAQMIEHAQCRHSAHMAMPFTLSDTPLLCVFAAVQVCANDRTGEGHLLREHGANATVPPHGLRMAHQDVVISRDEDDSLPTRLLLSRAITTLMDVLSRRRVPHWRNGFWRLRNRNARRRRHTKLCRRHNDLHLLSIVYQNLCGFYISLNVIPTWIRWLAYLSIYKYVFEAFIVTQVRVCAHFFVCVPLSPTN